MSNLAPGVPALRPWQVAADFGEARCEERMQALYVAIQE